VRSNHKNVSVQCIDNGLKHFCLNWLGLILEFFIKVSKLQRPFVDQRASVHNLVVGGALHVFSCHIYAFEYLVHAVTAVNPAHVLVDS
jgi:hypothetical protein